MQLRLVRLEDACRQPGLSVRKSLVPVVTTRAAKGFGATQKQLAEGESSQRKSNPKGNKKVAKDAAAIAGGRPPKHRPVRPEEAARGKLDYVQVADWGDGDRSKLGELRLVSHAVQYEGGAVAGAGGDAPSGSAAGGGTAGGGTGSRSGASGARLAAESRPFHMQLARQLELAESRGALAVAGPPPPPLSEWSFREGRYVQYLTDTLEVHAALEDALREAITGLAAPGVDASSEAQPTAAATEAPAAAAPAPPEQCARAALLHLAPGRLGLERSAALRADLTALSSTAGYRAEAETAAALAAGEAAAEASAAGAAAAAGAAESEAEAAEAPGPGPGSQRLRGSGGSSPAGGGSATASKPGRRRDVYDCTSGPMARSYAHVLRRLGRVAAGGESEAERQEGALRLLAHAAVLHMTGAAAAVRCGAAATERLALLQRRAAATYHDYPAGVRDPRVTLSSALDAAGAHLASPVSRQVVFDELPRAMQKTGLLLSALAHRD